MARPISNFPRKQSISIAFDGITITELRQLAKEHNISVSALVNNFCGNLLVLTGKLALELEPGEPIPEFLIRFVGHINSAGKMEIVREMENSVIENSSGCDDGPSRGEPPGVGS